MYMKGSDTVAELGNNEGVYVDKGTLSWPGSGAAKTAEGDTMSQITKLGGKGTNGAIIVATVSSLPSDG